ncbi:MAG: hypothetical protein CMI74_04035 [Candidatus Pelagibacter sp.]|nr:hypothetical protein [Candidatus Pelagibacter sp.]|tara:strand:- start:3676 stop:4167 length:492 start_codon:yes stop_codon:yes gene_type:complete
MQKRKQRAKAVKVLKVPKNSRKGTSNHLVKLQQTPEGREQLAKWAKLPKKAGRPKGVPDGFTRETIAPIKAEAQIYAKKVVEIMSDKYIIEDQYQKEALTTAVELMRMEGQARERLAAARLVLDFTKSKPATKSDVSISKAEDFLASLLEEEKKDGKETSENT